MFVRAGGADFHFGAGKLMEKEGSSPVVNEFAAAIDAHARFGVKKCYLPGIAAIESTSDFWI